MYNKSSSTITQVYILHFCSQELSHPLLTCWFGWWASGPLRVAGTGLSRDTAPHWVWGYGRLAEPGPPSEGLVYPLWPHADPPGSSPGWLAQPIPYGENNIYKPQQKLITTRVTWHWWKRINASLIALNTFKNVIYELYFTCWITVKGFPPLTWMCYNKKWSLWFS